MDNAGTMRIRQYLQSADPSCNKKGCKTYPAITIETDPFDERDGDYCEKHAAEVISEDPKLMALVLVSDVLRPRQQQGITVSNEMLKSLSGKA